MGKDNGTRIRTILAILASVNTALAALDVAQFGNEKVNLIYKVASVIVNALLIAVNTYYNNQYTDAACLGTGLTRSLKDPTIEQQVMEDDEVMEDDGGEND